MSVSVPVINRVFAIERATAGSQALVAHLGFDRKTIGTDARAKRIFGDDDVARIDEVLNEPRIVIKAGSGSRMARRRRSRTDPSS